MEERFCMFLQVVSCVDTKVHGGGSPCAKQRANRFV